MWEDDPFLSPWICLAVMRLGARMASRFDLEFAEQGITQAQFRLMMAVHYEGGAKGISPSALADYLLIERPTVSILAARLVERGLLARRPGENRRTHQLTLTPAGRQILAQVAPRAVALSHETLTGTTPDDLRRMREMLERLEARIRDTTNQTNAETRKEG